MIVLEDIIVYKNGTIFRNGQEIDYIIVDGKLAFTSKYCYVYNPDTYLNCMMFMDRHDVIKEYLYFVDSLIYGIYHNTQYSSIQVKHINEDQLDNALSNLSLK
jgi:hypothetical protein